ncbi:uncharacterized protein DSM5745_01211 [Aspergillus mulundensis]|uniref:DUF6546 domain-containing protein n=1 Tax=Aspergillus mulundensis TaxID=1810919 RepID=A0A3D8T5S9_9EURO|nr:hypothetical protein DSM5745_01211 [Aspergillus mulundensis]RDW93889.1 hypothetical protein DSM5745_01211 [Aspergillus mulundensis]
MAESRQYRRSFLRHLHYTIVVPHKLEPYNAMKLENQEYREQNPVREANNRAFSTAVISLLNTLSCWEASAKIALVIEVRGRQKTLEPGTKEHAGLEKWQTVFDGEQWVVHPYTARFPDDEPSLPKVVCIDQLLFDHMGTYQGVWNASRAALQIAEHHTDTSQGIWAASALQIAERCVALERLQLYDQEWVRPDHLSYMRERRQAMASALTKMPPTLRVFQCIGNTEEHWADVLPALNLLPDNKIDALSSSLRNMSLNLKELDLSEVTVELDFLFPLDDAGAPTTDALSLHWPYLETVTLGSVPLYLPSGKWLLDYDRSDWLSDDEENPDPNSSGIENFDTPWLRYGWSVHRNIMDVEQFHRLFISLGFAAQRMPSLKTMTFALECGRPAQFRFTTGRGSSEKPTLTFESTVGYKPDERVADAWGFCLDDMEVEDDGPEELDHYILATVTLPRFPLQME